LSTRPGWKKNTLSADDDGDCIIKPDEVGFTDIREITEAAADSRRRAMAR